MNKYQKTLKELKIKYPKSKNIVFGSNNIINGYWFDNGDLAKLRTFYPLTN